MERFDCAIVGASFGGLACATSLARAGARVMVLERKRDPGEKLHTTGIIVKDAMDGIALLEGLPPNLVRRIDGVRLYAPNLRRVDLAAPGYYFLATDTPAVMRWLADRAVLAGAKLASQTVFEGAARTREGFDVGAIGSARYLVGADGPASRVARIFSLGQSTQFLFGIEHEYVGAPIEAPDRLHCFIDRRVAPGYIGWVLSGVGIVQVGLARREREGQPSAREAMAAFLDKIAPIFDFRAVPVSSVRAGLIPCGGVVHPVAAPGVMLVGDAAGMVSPLTAGGIHTALKHGTSAGLAIADHLAGRCADPGEWFVRSYPRFRTKKALRWMFDHFQSDLAFNALLGTRALRAAAEMIYFHRRAR